MPFAKAKAALTGAAGTSGSAQAAITGAAATSGSARAAITGAALEREPPSRYPASTDVIALDGPGGAHYEIGAGADTPAAAEGERMNMTRVALLTSVLCVWFAAGTSGSALAAPTGAVRTRRLPDGSFSIENSSLGRVLTVEGGVLRTTAILNKRAGTKAVPLSCDEFRLRISRGTHTTGTDVVLTARDFRFVRTGRYAPDAEASAVGVFYVLKNAAHGLTVEVRYELSPGDFYMRKRLVVTPEKPVTLERVDVDTLALKDAEQPYTVRAIYARGKWSPGLGQPLYTTKSATFWGVEFPAADNRVEGHAGGKTLRCGYLWGREIKAGVPYRTHASVMGVSDDPAFNTDAFFSYIDRVRVRPLRLQIQYNTWFDTGRGVTKQRFRSSVELIHRKLAVERGTKPLRAYVIDDGWQDCRADWTDRTWKVNSKFDPDFATSFETVRAARSTLGLWLSPGCLFGASRMVGRYREKGFEALDNWMSLAGPKYMKLLEDRMVELTRRGVAYFKLDGLFGHLNLRNFELHGERYGIPHMPQLGLEGLKSGDAKLNDARYDELKIYYLTAGAERLMRIFSKMAETNPEVYIVISNGAWLSPWWLMHVDSVWMINAGDAAGGSSRTQELVYRDGKYHEIWRRENTQFPMHAIFNHEPKKTKTGETKDVFRKYLYMNLSRGTGFIELYIRPALLKGHDWDVIAEGLLWAEEVFPTFKRSRMHGGSPRAREPYGHTAWTEDQGYVSIHNPADEAKRYDFTLDRAFGLVPGSGPFHLSSPIADSVEGLAERYAYGDAISIEMKPRGIRVLNFDTRPRDWSVLKELQTRTEGPKPPEPMSIEGHAILGVWEYRHAGSVYTREFTKDGFCILRQGKKQIWRKLYAVEGDKTAVVGAAHRHVISDDGTLRVEGRYTATRR